MIFIKNLPPKADNSGRRRPCILVECEYCHKQYELRKELFDTAKNHAHCTKKHNNQIKAAALLTTGFKVCGHCKQTLLTTDFGKRASAPTGLRSTCKKCEILLSAETQKQYRSRPEVKQQKKKYDTTYVRQPEQKQRKKELSFIWKQNNPSKAKAIADNDRHRRRLAKQPFALSTKDLATWTEEQPKFCSYCGQSCSTNFHIDHIEPISKGGTHTLDNLTIACLSCNSSKSNKSLLLWLAFRQSL